MPHSCNDNQNYLVKPGRTTSRVLNPPGGKSSLSLGLAPVVKVEDKKEAKVVNKTEQPVSKAEEPVKKEESVVEKPTPAAVNTSTCLPKAADEPVSANAFASSSSMNGAQVMTGRPTSRVLQPGGGGGKASWKLG